MTNTPASGNVQTSNPPVSENPAALPSPSHPYEGAAFRQPTSISQALLLENAKSSAERDPSEFCRLFDAKASKLTEKSRIELARRIAEVHSYSLVKNIQKFAISDENAKFELVQIVAEKESLLFIRAIQNFEISDESIRIKLAHGVAERDPKALVDNIHIFEISSESAKVELFHKVTEKYLKNLTESIQNLRDNDNARARAAYKAAKQKLHYLASHIQGFKLSKESDKIELAKLIAERCPEVIAENIQKFEITDERSRIELGKIIAEKDLELLVRNFQNFAISDESIKLELAHFLIRKHLSVSLIDNGYFEKLQISNPSARVSLYASAYLGLVGKGEMNAADEKTWLKPFFLYDPQPMPLAQVAAQFGNRQPAIADLLKAAEQQSDPHIRKTLSTWAQLVSLRFAADQLPEAAWQDLKVPLEAIQKWRAPAMRYVLPHLLAQQCLPSEAKDANGFFAFCKQFTRPHTHLYPALLFPLFQSAPDDPTLKKFVALLHQSDFKEAKRQKAMINALAALVQADRLPDSLKRSLLQAALPNGSGHEAARSLAETAPLMECLVSFAQHSPKHENAVLQRLESIRNPDDFNDQMNKVFKDLFPNLPNAQNAAAHFNRYREHARHAMGLITYTVKMQNYWNHSEKAPVLAAIGQFINATVLSPDPEHTFRQLRYDPAKSPHLRLLTEKAPAAFAQWKQPCIYEPSAAFQAQATPASRQDAKHFTVIDTDAAEDLFLCSTEVTDSCQSIHNIPFNNKTLMGYVLDGKYRMLAIKSEDGRLMGRRMLRLLWDEKTQQPVLHLEQFYQNPGIPEKYTQALVELALQKAKQMNCVLVSHDRELKHGNFYTTPLTAYPTPWPFEYVDAEKPGIIAGKEGYKLQGTRIVALPHQAAESA